MKFHPRIADLLGCRNESEAFDFLKRTLNESITYWDYFVNWKKVFENIQDVEVDLNTLNYLVGRHDVESEFSRLLEKQPRLARLVPVLLAVRKKKITILVDAEGPTYEKFDFSKKTLSEQERADIVRFARETGLLSLFRDSKIRSLPDYVLGVEVGLDSNGRKNRGGKSMEKLVGGLLRRIATDSNLDLLQQATAAEIEDAWGIAVQIDKSDREFDFAINNGGTLYLIETNYYGGGGSKLKSTAGEYRALGDFLRPQGHRLVWITDGQGWKGTLPPLQETFLHNDFTLNLKMVGAGLLELILKEKL